MTTTDDLTALLAACIAHPEERDPRLRLQDLLRERDLWTHEQVLGYVLAHPGSDACRLLFSDWAESEGDGDRAEFIRTQVELWHMPPMGPRVNDPRYMLPEPWESLRRRERELWEANSGQWFGTASPNPLPGDLGWAMDDDGLFIRVAFPGGRGRYDVRRGFPECVHCPWEAWNTHADDIVKAWPVCEVLLTTWPDANVGDVSAEDWATAGFTFASALLRRELEGRWPGVTFTIPGADRYTHEYRTRLEAEFDDATAATARHGVSSTTNTQRHNHPPDTQPLEG